MTVTKQHHSTTNGNDYELSIWLPDTYDESSDVLLEAIYVLDANLFFDLLAAIVQYLSLIVGFPKTIVVGIGYPNCQMFGRNFGKALERFQQRRHQDFTPVRDQALEAATSSIYWGDQRVVSDSGHAAEFWACLEKEIIPQMDKDYRIAENGRTLIGHSLGGTFALLSLFHRPSLFSKYIVGSPSFGCCNGLVFDQERDYSTKYKTLDAEVFVGMDDGLEFSAEPFHCTVSELQRFSAALLSRNYRGLKYANRIYREQQHLSVAPLILAEGLKAIFL